MHWRREGDAVVYSLEVPEAVSATLYAPAWYAFADGSDHQSARTGEYRFARR